MDRAALIAAMQATAAAARQPVPVDTPWGKLFVKTFTVADVDRHREANAQSTDKRTLARGVARAVCDEDGNAIFDENSDADVTLIASQPYQKLMSIVRAANSANATDKEGQVEQGNG